MNGPRLPCLPAEGPARARPVRALPLMLWVAALVASTAALCASSASAAGVAPPSGLSARAAVVIEQSTGQVLWGYSEQRELPIASTTKLMTALLTIEHAPLTQVFADPDYKPAAVDSQIGLHPGERMTVHDLLLALLLPSADDAAEDLAYNVGRGSVGRFVGMMNARARSLGLTHTHYSTPSGLDTPGNYSSASDLVKLASYLLTRHPFFARAVALPSAVLRSGDQPRFVTNTDTLVGQVRWINGVKTGHTLDAGYVLVGSGNRDGMTLVSAVLGTPSESARDADTLALLDYGFGAFRLVKPVLAGAVLTRVPVRDQPGKHAELIAAKSFVHVAARDAPVTTRLEIPHRLAGPLPRHAVVGTVVVLEGGRTLARIPVLLARALPAVSPLTLVARFITKPLTLLVLLAVLAAALLAVRRRRQAAVRTRSRRRPHTPKTPVWLEHETWIEPERDGSPRSRVAGSAETTGGGSE